MPRMCLVTGANSGIGRVTAEAFAANGDAVILVCRNRAKGEAALQEIQRATGNRDLTLLLADMADQQQIRDLAAQVKANFPALHVLVNNAGAYFSQRTLTADGYEMTFAVNHLGYFLLTVELLELLKASAPARIINVASGMHQSGRLNFNDLHLTNGYNGWGAYANSKLANVLFTYELARRLENTSVTVNAMHPGGVATNFFDDLNQPMKLLVQLSRPFMRTPQKGAETVIWLAHASEVANMTGRYFMDRKPRKSSRRSYDQAMARRLWEVSEQLTHTN